MRFMVYRFMDFLKKGAWIWYILTGIALLFINVVYTGSGNEFDDFSLDYAYPNSYFYRIEATAKELCSDLDALGSENQAITTCLKESSYLQEQFAKLNNAAHNLLTNTQEVMFYLPEDIQYLLAVLDCVEEKYIQVAHTIKNCTDHATADINQCLAAARSVLEQILMHNEEVSLC